MELIWLMVGNFTLANDLKNFVRDGCLLFVGTPVLDIKPYIPAYDYPGAINTTNLGKVHLKLFTLVVAAIDNITDTLDREEPDGEENFGTAQLPTASSSAVKVPNWINNPTKMDVKFTDRATEQLRELELNKVMIECRMSILFFNDLCLNRMTSNKFSARIRGQCIYGRNIALNYLRFKLHL